MVKSGLRTTSMRADQGSPPRGLAAAPPVSFSRVEGGSAQLKNTHRSYENRVRFIAKVMRKSAPFRIFFAKRRNNTICRSS
jgi:hypothetical protein